MSDNLTLQNYIPLDSISVANPCNADWNAMKGDNRARFCGTCQKNVYNLSDMSRREAEELLRSRGDSLCAQFARRADGTVITDDCQVGLRPLRNGAGSLMRVVVMGTAAIIALAAGSSRRGEAIPSPGKGSCKTAGASRQGKAPMHRMGRMALKVRPLKAAYQAAEQPPTIRGDIATPAPTPTPTPPPPTVTVGNIAMTSATPAPTPAPPTLTMGKPMIKTK